MSEAWVMTSMIAMLSAMPAGISPNGSFTILSIAPGASNAAIARCDAVAHAPCGSVPTLSPPISRPNTSSGTEPCSAEIANIVAPPTMWFTRSFTDHSLHNVGLDSCSADVRSSTRLVVSTTRCIIEMPSTIAPSGSEIVSSPHSLPSGRWITRALSPHGPGVDGDERLAGHGLQLVEVRVVPLRGRGAGDVPGAAVVGDDHPVGLQRLEDHERLPVEMSERVARLQAQAQSHRREGGGVGRGSAVSGEGKVRP